MDTFAVHGSEYAALRTKIVYASQEITTDISQIQVFHKFIYLVYLPLVS